LNKRRKITRLAATLVAALKKRRIAVIPRSVTGENQRRREEISIGSKNIALASTAKAKHKRSTYRSRIFVRVLAAGCNRERRLREPARNTSRWRDARMESGLRPRPVRLFHGH
jgi:hypothetical protein